MVMATAQSRDLRRPRTRVEWLPTQLKVLQSRDKAFLFVGGNGCGKTDTIAGIALDETTRYANNLGVIAAGTYPQLLRGPIRKVEKWLAKRGIIQGKHYRYNKNDKEVRFPNGSGWIYVSSEVDAKFLEGMELGWLMIDEIPSVEEEQAAALISRVRLPDMSHRIGFFGYPPPIGHWTYRRFVEDPIPGDAVYRMTTHENLKKNGGFLDDDYLARLESMYRPGTPIWRRKVMAEFAQMEGLVYEAFDAPRHIRAPHEIPTEGTSLYFGLDFGYTNPLCFLRGVLDSNDVLWIDAEHYRSHLLIEHHEPLMRPMYAAGAPIFSDHDVHDREHLIEWAYNCKPAIKRVHDGIEAVVARLQTDRLMFVQHRCPNLIREMGSYAWDSRVEPGTGEQMPVKKNDHAVDALRYLVAGLDLDERVNPKLFVPEPEYGMGGLGL